MKEPKPGRNLSHNYESVMGGSRGKSGDKMGHSEHKASPHEASLMKIAHRMGGHTKGCVSESTHGHKK